MLESRDHFNMAAVIAAAFSGGIALYGARVYLQKKRGERELIAYSDPHFKQLSDTDRRLDYRNATLLSVDPGVDINISENGNVVPGKDPYDNFNTWVNDNRSFPTNPGVGNRFAAVTQREEIIGDKKEMKWLQNQLTAVNHKRHSTFSDDNPFEMTDRMIHKILPPQQIRTKVF